MNQVAVLFHLREAKAELDQTINRLATNPSYDPENFVVAMSHLYHHLNTAWNGRDASRERHRDSAAADFHAWRKFPENSELLLD